MSLFNTDPDLIRQCIETTIGGGVQEGPETSYPCPFCARAGYEGIGHLHVNFRKNKALCHRCMWKCRDLQFLVLALLGKIPRSMSRLTSDQDVEDVVNTILFSEDGMSTPREQPVQLPEGFVPLTGRPNERLGKVVLEYLTERGVPFDRLVEVGAGYCNSGLLRGYAIFPVLVRGDLITFTSRRVVGMGSKVRHAYASDASLALFNHDNVGDARRVFVGEGPFDAWAFHRRIRPTDAGVATLGTTVHTRQARLMSDMPCEEIVVCYDADAPDKARTAAAKIQRITGKKVSMMFPPKDPDEFPLEELTTLVKGRTVCDPEGDEIRCILGVTQ